jgi:N-acetylmuramoyl-L-alanine amidase
MLCVTAKSDYTHLKITDSSSYYNDYTVQSAGMTDYAVSLYGGFYKLRMGGFVSEEAVFETDALPSEKITISSAKLSSDGRETTLRLECDDKVPYNGAVDGERFVLTLYNVDAESAPVPKIEKNPLFAGCEIVKMSDRVRYSLKLHDPLNFYGFDLEYVDGAIEVSFNSPRAIDTSALRPLEGITIVLDAGHGGDDPGAAGAYSGDGKISESDLNLAIALEAEVMLRKLGANVIMMRSDDTAIPIMDRVYRLEELEPDLCISVHQNSMGYSTDITRIRGTLALWCMDSGHLLSDVVGRSVADALGRRLTDSRYQMLAMCRNPKFPAALIEVGFMTSVEEYEQMTSSAGIKKAASGIADGVINYFERQGEYIKKYT